MTKIRLPKRLVVFRITEKPSLVCTMFFSVNGFHVNGFYIKISSSLQKKKLFHLIAIF